MRVRKGLDAAYRAPFQPVSDKLSTPETLALDPRGDSDDGDIPADMEQPVPDELIETLGNDGDVQNGKI